VFGLWHEESSDVIGPLVSSGWISVASNQRFALRQPNLTAPEIIQACEDKNLRGFAKAAHVLLVVEKAVRTKLDTEARAQLIELSKV
jgi:predicted transcriptional regulator